MQKITLMAAVPILILISLSGCVHEVKTDSQRTPADLSGAPTEESTKVVISEAGQVRSGPRGGLLANPTEASSDGLYGSWSSGLKVDINRLFSQNGVPDKIVIADFDLRMPDGNKVALLALTAEEEAADASKRSEVLFNRAQKICDRTKTHRYIHSVQTKPKLLSGLLMDVLSEAKTEQGVAYKTYPASKFSGARYFIEIVCGVKAKAKSNGFEAP